MLKVLRIGHAVVMIETSFDVLAQHAHELHPDVAQRILQAVDKYCEARRRQINLAVLQPESQARN